MINTCYLCNKEANCCAGFSCPITGEFHTINTDRKCYEIIERVISEANKTRKCPICIAKKLSQESRMMEKLIKKGELIMSRYSIMMLESKFLTKEPLEEKRSQK